MNNNNYCVIMAGGVGSRFWPVSKMQKPKQFLDILGTGRTLLQQTYDRMSRICPKENILIVSSDIYESLIYEQIPEIKPERVLLEPMRRNTAPCIAYANYKILKENMHANIVVTPADHLILKEEEFVRVINQGLDFIQHNNVLLTIGIKPNRPETGYGYIQMDKENKDRTIKNADIKKVKTFTEKPELAMAKVFLESGEFLWNAGIFIWSLNSILVAFEKNLSEVNSLFSNEIDSFNTDSEKEAVKKIYAESKNISVDYGIMEKAENVYVYSADLGWSDLGTWGSLHENSQPNSEGNVIIGQKTLVYNSANCIVNVPSDKLVVIQGLNDFIVTESEGTLLICARSEEQQIRQIVNDVKLKFGEQYI